MLDFNTSAGLSERMACLVDPALQAEHRAQPKRAYLGASSLGVACERALQYSFAKAPVDGARQTEARILRIFKRGHVMEDCMADWLRTAGFDLLTHKANGAQIGFSILDGQLAGHIDGVFVGGPAGFAYPALWESKCLGSKSWRDLQKRQLAVSKPVYAAQIAIYQAYLELHENPAIFTAINADSMEIYTELVPFDAALAQRMSDRALKVITATSAGEQLARGFHESTHFECRMCQWQDRCWKESR